MVATLIEFMDYTLAKKLKDAGFPKKEHTLDDATVSYCVRCSYMESYTQAQSHKGVDGLCVTLSELIDACGEKFDALGKCKDDGVSGIVDGWIAVDEDNKRTWGATKEEAVANLWLAINK